MMMTILLLPAKREKFIFLQNFLFFVQYKPLNVITLGQTKSYNMYQILTNDLYFVNGMLEM